VIFDGASMPDTAKLPQGQTLIARVWDAPDETRSLVASQVRNANGKVVTTWFVPPNTIRTTLWIETLVPPEQEPSLP
jgi:hypothetical protein